MKNKLIALTVLSALGLTGAKFHEVLKPLMDAGMSGEQLSAAGIVTVLVLLGVVR